MKPDELDRVLDEALASYSLQEARAGLSGRVLARVRSDGARGRSGWMRFAIAALALACGAIVMFIWRGRERVEPIALAPPHPSLKVEQSREIPMRVTRVRVTYVQRPRLDSFPGPAPLSPEERALVAFAQQAPEAALRLAQADKPLEIEEINIRPILIDGLQTGEMK